MTRLSRLSAAAAVLLVAACTTVAKPPAPPPPPGSDGETLSKAMMERKLLDSCMYRQFQTAPNRNRLVEDCRCAARGAMKNMSEPYVVARTGKLSGAQEISLREGFAACVKP
jgi:hypothetical protein